jgi:hypothetical protein
MTVGRAANDFVSDPADVSESMLFRVNALSSAHRILAGDKDLIGIMNDSIQNCVGQSAFAAYAAVPAFG